MDSDLLVALINAGGFLLCVGFIGYVLLILIPYLRRVPATAGDRRALQWHFMIPCLNEERVIEQTVRSLVTQFPECRLWCIDDGSTDGTGAVLAELAAWSDRVHVVTRWGQECQLGKGAALNAGWRALDNWLPEAVDRHEIIVGVLDADGQLDPRCLDAVSGPSFFGDTDVGAVQVRVRVALDPTAGRVSRFGRLLVRLQDVEFNGVIAAMQTLRQNVGSVGMGGNGQFTRLTALNRIAEERGTPWHDALCEDLELGLRVLLEGFRTEYCHDTWVRQQGLPSIRRLVRQRSRWAQGAMQCIRYLGPVLRSPRIGNSGALEIAYFLLVPWLQVVGALFYTVTTALVIYLAFTVSGGPMAWAASTGWGLLVLFVLFALGPFAVWGPVYRRTTAPDLSRLQGVALGLACWPYAYVNQVAAWWAFTRMVRSRHDWKKTERQPAPLPSMLEPAAVPAIITAPAFVGDTLGDTRRPVAAFGAGAGPRRVIVSGTVSLDSPQTSGGSRPALVTGRFIPSDHVVTELVVPGFGSLAATAEASADGVPETAAVPVRAREPASV